MYFGGDKGRRNDKIRAEWSPYVRKKFENYVETRMEMERKDQDFI